jgi:hypothetical protein
VPLLQVRELLACALAWRAQGAASRWTTPASVRLVGMVDILREQYPALCAELEPPKAGLNPMPTTETLQPGVEAWPERGPYEPKE